MTVTIVFGWMTLIGVIAGVLLPLVDLAFIYKRFKAALAHGRDATRAEVHGVFELQAVVEAYSKMDWVNDAGRRFRNWPYRALVFLRNVLPSVLGLGAVGLIADNAIFLFQ